MPVVNGQQNKHRWWGILTIDSGMENSGGLAEGTQCVFIKANRDSHFVSQGTFVSKVRVFKSLKDAEDVLLRKASKAGASEIEIRRIKSDLKKINALKTIPSIVEILGIDYKKTPPLAVEVNILTESLFRNGAWLRANGNRIGADDIKLGLRLPPLP